MKNEISTNVAVAKGTRRRPKVTSGDKGINAFRLFGPFWMAILYQKNHPMRPFVKTLIERNEEINLKTAMQLYLAYCDQVYGK